MVVMAVVKAVMMAVMKAVMMVVIEVNGGGDKSVKKSSKSRRIVKNLKGLKNLQRPLVRRNVYQSTDPPSIKYKELKLPLEF